MTIDIHGVFAALGRVIVRSDADPEAVRLRLVKESVVGNQEIDPRVRVGAILDALPPPPQLYWHGKDGAPCACYSCSMEAGRVWMEVKAELERPPR